MEENSVISATSLKIGYTSGRLRLSILSELNATAQNGQLIAVLGRNGIGKSTLLRTLTGLQPSLGGAILISGRKISDFSRLELARKIGYISTEVIRTTSMTVHDLVSLGRFPYTNWTGYLDSANRLSVSQAIKMAGLEGFENRLVAELSDGERQRAMIARVLAQDTEILIMDEPTAFLDIAGRYEIIKLIHDLTRLGKTIIYSTHDLYPALSYADKIWLLLSDRMIEGNPDTLINNGSLNLLFESTEFSFDPQTRRPVIKDNSGNYL